MWLLQFTRLSHKLHSLLNYWYLVQGTNSRLPHFPVLWVLLFLSSRYKYFLRLVLA
jgi:hypothetical protein